MSQSSTDIVVPDVVVHTHGFFADGGRFFPVEVAIVVVAADDTEHGYCAIDEIQNAAYTTQDVIKNLRLSKRVSSLAWPTLFPLHPSIEPKQNLEEAKNAMSQFLAQYVAAASPPPQEETKEETKEEDACAVAAVMGCIGPEQCDYFKNLFGFSNVVDITSQLPKNQTPKKVERVMNKVGSQYKSIGCPHHDDEKEYRCSINKAWQWTVWMNKYYWGKKKNDKEQEEEEEEEEAKTKKSDAEISGDDEAEEITSSSTDDDLEEEEEEEMKLYVFEFPNLKL